MQDDGMEDERRSSNGVERSKQDKRQMGMVDGSRMKGEPTPVDIWSRAIVEGVQIQYETCSTERVEGFMASFEYRGDTSIFIASGSNGALCPTLNYTH
jgi:hypothetical protein